MTPSRLERIIGIVLRTGVMVSTVCLGVGLVLSFLGTGPIALLLLDLGVVVLLATPVVRVVVSIVEYAQRARLGVRRADGDRAGRARRERRRSARVQSETVRGEQRTGLSVQPSM